MSIAALQGALRAVERLRRRRILVYYANDQRPLLDQDVEPIYNCLRKMGPQDHLDLVLNTSGGILSVAHRVGLLCRSFCGKFSILVPAKARSAGTLLCLAADEIVLGPLAELSPLDPVINSRSSGQGLPASISSESIDSFRQLAEKWFGLKGEAVRLELFKILNQHFFPTALSSLFRADKYVRRVSEELLGYQLPRTSISRRRDIVELLIKGYPDHLHALPREYITKIGLRARFMLPQEDRHIWKLVITARSYLEENGLDGVILTRTHLFQHAKRRAKGAISGSLEEPLSGTDSGATEGWHEMRHRRTLTLEVSAAKTTVVA
jgi:hypothetical protein